VGRVDEDKHPDIVFGNAANRLVVLDGAQGVELFSLELEGPFLDPVVVDLDGDRENEIIVVYENGVIQRFDRSLNLQWSHTGDRITTAPLIADLNDDGTDDLVVPTFGMEVVALDGSTGFEMWRFYDARTEIVHSPVGLELNRDRVTDVLFATRGGMLHALDGATGWGLWKRTIHGKPAGSPVPADLDDSGSREIVCVTDTGVVTGHSTAGDKLFAWELEARFRTPPSLGDIDRDGVIEIVMVDQDTVRVFAGNTRREKWSYNLDQGPVIGRIALADCNGEKGMEVVVSTVPGAVYVLDGVTGAVSGIFNGRSYNFTTPLLVDTNSDRINEMVVGSYDGQVYALQIAGVEKPLIALTRSGWKSVNHDPLNTGFSERVLRLPGIR
jgi:outer membrane protein assembly factor BamB